MLPYGNFKALGTNRLTPQMCSNGYNMRLQNLPEHAGDRDVASWRISGEKRCLYDT